MTLVVDRPAVEAAPPPASGRLRSALLAVIAVALVVLGGGLSNIAQLYEQLPGALGQYVFSDTLATRIVRPRHGDSSGVRGAAWLWPLAT